MLRETRGVDRRAGDDELEFGATGEELLEVPEQKVDGEAALVGLVDDDGVVVLQFAIAAEGGEQDAVGHERDARVLAHLVGEAHFVADEPAEF